MPTPIPFLMYHEIGLPGRAAADAAPGYMRYVVGHDAFGAQLRRMRALGLEGTDVDGALEARDSAVAITFDDGCETDLIAAAPLLAELGMRATFYITVGFLGRRGFLSRSQLRELADGGWSIGAHGMTHRFLTDLPPEEVRVELLESKDRLEQTSGHGVHHFSCPGGRWDPASKDMAAAAGYRSVATSRPRVWRPADGPWSIGRFAITRGLDDAQFTRIATGRGLPIRRFRDNVLRVAKGILGNDGYDRMRDRILRRAASRESE
jgi:peptidoglycan/xylan/chitin deacetylase (PgdA/CDA1 family)